MAHTSKMKKPKLTSEASVTIKVIIVVGCFVEDYALRKKEILKE